MNESGVLYILVRNATVINGAGVPPFIADIGIAANRRVRDADGQRELQITTTIDDMGDLRTLGALRTIDATGMTAVPLVDEKRRSRADRRPAGVEDAAERDDRRRPAGAAGAAQAGRRAWEVPGRASAEVTGPAR